MSDSNCLAYAAVSMFTNSTCPSTLSASWSKELTRADLNMASPYNTRRYHGLPPGPICNPGLGAINAAANPVRTPYLYFVASTSGKVFYAKTGAEFQQAIAKAKANG